MKQLPTSIQRTQFALYERARCRFVSQAGVTLVEILITLAIGLIVTLAVAVTYVGSRTTATAVDNLSRLNENAKLTLDFLSREIQMAGFYPSIFPNPAQPLLRGEYINLKAPRRAYNAGIFGCDGAPFDPTTANNTTTFGCGAAVAGAPDSLVVNYFTTVSQQDVGLDNVSVNTDCESQPVALDPDNATRAGAGLPILLSNRFTATTTNYSSAVGRVNTEVATLSLACNGNGGNAETTDYAQLFDGINQLVFRYAVHDLNTSGETPQRFFTAAEVNALPVINGRSGWQRVSGVSVCLLMQSLNASRTTSLGTGGGTYTDCYGTVVTPAAGDRFFYKRYDRVVAVRNQLTGIQ